MKLMEFLFKLWGLQSCLLSKDFSVFRTQMTDTEALISAVQELGYLVIINAESMPDSHPVKRGLAFDESAEAVINSLQCLGLSTDVIRGSNPGRVNVVTILEGNCYLGWAENNNVNDNNLNLIIDLWAVSQHYNISLLINSILEKYHEIKAR